MRTPKPRSGNPLRSLIHKHAILRRSLTVALICAGFVLYEVTPGGSTPGELHPTPASLLTASIYQDAVHTCQHVYEALHHRHWCGEFAFAPGFNDPPSVAKAASQGVKEFANFSNGYMQGNGAGPLTWPWNWQTGLWGGHTLPHWWQSALSLRTLVRYLEATHNTDPIFQKILIRTYTREVLNPFAIASDYFVNLFGDDSAWWGLAWIEAAKYERDVLHNVQQARTFLGVAEYDANFVQKMPKACGGVEWKIGTPPDTITNAEYATLLAELSAFRSNSGPFHDGAKASKWLGMARYYISWLERHRLIDIRNGTVHDQLSRSCNKLISGPLTYTEGQVAEAFVQMGSALNDPSYYQTADAFLRYATSNKRSGEVSPNGIIQEPCERDRFGCTGSDNYLDVLSWKGILVQALSDYTTATGSREYHWLLHRQGQAIVHNAISRPNGQPGNCDVPQDCQFVFYWAVPLSPVRSGFVNQATQMDALDALTAALALPADAHQARSDASRPLF